ncbi:hypothetical protein BOX15_Mlig012543g2, partial [Macrostomum lignano]
RQPSRASHRDSKWAAHTSVNYKLFGCPHTKAEPFSTHLSLRFECFYNKKTHAAANLSDMSIQCETKAPSAPAPLRANHNVPLFGAGALSAIWPGQGAAAGGPARLFASRTQPQLHSASAAAPSTPVAKVQPMKRPAPAVAVGSYLPLKRPAPLANAEDEVDDDRPPAPKQLPRCRPASPAIATNPLYRRRSRDIPSGGLPDRHQSVVANVAFPTLTTTPIFQQTAAAAAVSAGKIDAQTSPRQPAVPEASAATPGASASGMSLTNWVRSARCRLARLRRSFSASRVDAAAATKSTSMLSGSDAPTPKRLFASRKRHASLQRLVQRLAASPAGGPTVTSAKKISSPRGSGTASSVGTSSPMAVSGRVLKLMPDGSRLVQLKRPRGGKFGFFVLRQKGGVYLSRFNDPATQRRYRSVLGVGDEILEIEGMPTTAMPLDDLYRFISDKRSLLIRVRSCYSW